MPLWNARARRLLRHPGIPKRNHRRHRPALLGHLRHDLGLPAQATKSATLRQLVLQAPAPVVADALGFSAKHMTRIWGAAGSGWTTYATRERGRDSPR